MYTFDENLISDLHKDAYGFRPTQSFWASFAAFNPEQKQALWDSMLADLERSIKNEQDEYKSNIERFEKRIDNLMHDGTTRQRMAQWLINYSKDIEGCEYELGLPFGYLKSKEYV